MKNKLLRLLDENARLTNAELAVMTGMTEAEVAAQIAAWEKTGVIRAYKALIDWEKTDREYVIAIIEVRATPKCGAGFDEIARAIAKFEEVETVCLMSGGYDFSIVVSGRTFQEVAMFVGKRLSTLDSVVSTATHFVLRRYKDENVMFVDEETDERGAF